MSVTDGYLTFEHGEIRLGDSLVPGTLKSMSIRGVVRFDESSTDERSGKVKTPMGWADADISLTVELLTDEDSNCYEKLSDLNAIFKGADNKANPKVYEVDNEHVMARGIQRVVFSGLDSSETDEDDVITANLNFVEHIPPITKKEERAAASAGAATETPAVKTAEPKISEAIVLELE